MWRSLFLSTISLAACSSGPHCGPGDAPAIGIVATGTGITFTYGGFTASANGDCGPSSITIEGQTNDTVGFFTICVPQPSKLSGGLAFGPDANLVDTSGTASGCMYVLDGSAPATGMVSTTGECDNGTSSAGFAMTVTGTAQVKPKMCGAIVDPVPVTLSGTVAVQ